VSDPFGDLELRLGFVFRDRDLLQCALTHPSYSLENGGDDYERLEFLGDSILGWVVATHLYGQFPDLAEGSLTKLKSALTSGRALTPVARELGLGECMRFGKGAAKEASRASVLENSFEALIGAVYLDGGADAAREFVLRLLGDRIDPTTLLATVSDAKSRLQELTQHAGMGLPVYDIVECTGPAHDPTFTVSVTIRGTVRGSGAGASKQDAQQAAATAALEDLGKL